MQDRKDRETNFIVFNAPEPDTNVKETRVQEDIELIRGLCNDVCSLDINPQNDIVEVIRLGKKTHRRKHWQSQTPKSCHEG